MKPLEAELALFYCRQARDAIARTAKSVPLSSSDSELQRLERALFYLAELERRIRSCSAKAARP